MTSNSDSGRKSHIPLPWDRRLQPATLMAALVLLALADAGFYLLAVWPAERKERTLVAEIAALQAEIGRTRQGTAALVEAAARIDDAEHRGAELVEQISLPRRTAFSALLSELGGVSEEAGMQIREASYSVTPIEGSDSYGILAVNANFRGSYKNLMELLFRLDRSELFFIIGSLGATPREDGGASELQVNMRFDTFVRDL